MTNRKSIHTCENCNDEFMAYRARWCPSCRETKAPEAYRRNVKQARVASERRAETRRRIANGPKVCIDCPEKGIQPSENFAMRKDLGRRIDRCRPCQKAYRKDPRRRSEPKIKDHVCYKCMRPFPRYRTPSGKWSVRSTCDKCRRKQRVDNIRPGSNGYIKYDPREMDSRPCSRCGDDHSRKLSSISKVHGIHLFASYCAGCHQRRQAKPRAAAVSTNDDLIRGAKVLIQQRQDATMLLGKVDDLLSRRMPDHELRREIARYLRGVSA